MSRPNPSSSPRIQVERELLNSPAFRALKSPNSVRVLLDLLAKRCWAETPGSKKRKKVWAFINNGEIEYTYKEAKGRGMSGTTFARALDELIGHGFVDIEATGAGVFELKTLYRISERWRKWGKDEFEVKKRPKKNRWAQGIGFQPGHRFYPPKS